MDKDDELAQNLSENILYRNLIGITGKENMPVDVLLSSYKFLDHLVRCSPKNSIKMNVPETLILTDD